jgi:hypothetical protein
MAEFRRERTSLASDAIKHRIARRRAETEEAEAFFPPRATTK